MQTFEPNMTELTKEKQKMEKDYSNDDSEPTTVPVIFLKNGITQVRILPPYSDKGVWFRMLYEHTIQTDEGSWVTVTCPGQFDEPCPLCERGQELREEGTEESTEMSKNLEPRKQYLYNVICFSAPVTDEKWAPKTDQVSVLKSGVMVFRQILQLDQDEATGWNDITSLDNGVTLTIKRTGKGFDTKYAVNPHGQGRSDLKKVLDAQGVDIDELNTFQLDDLFPIRPYDDLKALAAGGTLRRSKFIGANFTAAHKGNGAEVPEIPGME